MKTAFLFAFDLIELDGEDLRREPPVTRKRRSPASRPTRVDRRLRFGSDACQFCYGGHRAAAVLERAKRLAV